MKTLRIFALTWLVLATCAVKAEVPNDIAIRLRDDVYLRVSEVEQGLLPRTREDLFKELRELLIFGNDDLVRAQDRAYSNEVLKIVQKYVSTHNVQFAPEARLIRAISKNLDLIRDASIDLGETFPRNLSGRFEYLAGLHSPPYLDIFLKESIQRIQSLKTDADLRTIKKWVQSFSNFLEENVISCDALLRG